MLSLKMKKMRRKDRAIPDDEAAALLEKAEYGVLSTVSEEGVPYGVPLNFCFIDGCLFFHSAVTGLKLDNIQANKTVSFCIVGETQLLPAKFSTRYESVIVSGEAEEVFAAEKRRGLEGLLRKYSPGHMERGKRYIDTDRQKTRVFKITITALTGKARR